MHYTFLDKEYFETLRMLADQFERQEIAYALVGGSGIQARISYLLSRKHKSGIKGVCGIELLLRETKDFDIASNGSQEDYIEYFNTLQAINPQVEVREKGIRSKEIVNHDHYGSIVVMNYQTGPQDLSGLDESFYQDCLDNAEYLNLNYRKNNGELGVYVASPEILVTSKLTRYSSKDIVDVSNLLKVMRSSGKIFNEGKVKKYLERAERPEIFGRLVEIKRQVLKE